MGNKVIKAYLENQISLINLRIKSFEDTQAQNPSVGKDDVFALRLEKDKKVLEQYSQRLEGLCDV